MSAGCQTFAHQEWSSLKSFHWSLAFLLPTEQGFPFLCFPKLMPEVSWTLLWSYKSPSCCLCLTTCHWAWHFWETKVNPLEGSVCRQAGWGWPAAKQPPRLDWAGLEPCCCCWGLARHCRAACAAAAGSHRVWEEGSIGHIEALGDDVVRPSNLQFVSKFFVVK